MKTKKWLLVFVIIIIIFSVRFFLLGSKEVYKTKVFSSTIDEIFYRMKEKEDFLIYIMDDRYDKCYLCPDVNKIIKYYEEVYGLEFIYFNKNEESEDDYNSLLKKLGYENNFFVNPSIIIMKDGKDVRGISEVVFESDFRDYFIEYDFIDAKFKDTDVGILDDNSFNKIYNSSNRTLIVVYTFENEGYALRKKVFDYSNKYKFKYYNIYYGVGGSFKPYSTISMNIGKQLSVPSLVVVNKGKVISYYCEGNNSFKIKQFLTKNKIIK